MLIFGERAPKPSDLKWPFRYACLYQQLLPCFGRNVLLLNEQVRPFTSNTKLVTQRESALQDPGNARGNPLDRCLIEASMQCLLELGLLSCSHVVLVSSNLPIALGSITCASPLMPSNISSAASRDRQALVLPLPEGPTIITP